MRHKLIGSFLGIILCLLFIQTANAKFIIVDGFTGVENRQQTPVWCWASVIQMLLNKNGIQWSQLDVVKAVKGYVAVQTATSEEITGFLNSWGVDYDGSHWKSASVKKAGAPNPGRLIYELQQHKPLILTFETGPGSGHLVVAYGAVTRDFGNGRSALEGVTIYDPYDDQVKYLPRDEFFSTVKEHWFVSINRPF